MKYHMWSSRFLDHRSTTPSTIVPVRLDDSYMLLFLMILTAMQLSAQADCPGECTCKWKSGKQTVECAEQGLTDVPMSIETGTQVLDLSRNNFLSLGSHQFQKLGLVNLQKIYLQKCKIGYIDDRAFLGLTNLVDLDLRENQLVVVPTGAFHQTTSLMRLVLNNNPITALRRRAFGPMLLLTSLELSNCDIEEIDVGAFDGLDSLEWLTLDGNDLKVIGGYSVLPNTLQSLDLHNNPWRCDCSLLPLNDWIQRSNVPVSSDPKCATPTRLFGISLKNLTPNDLACFPDVSPTTLYLEVQEGKNVSLFCKVIAIPEASIEWWYDDDRIFAKNQTQANPRYIFSEDGSTEKRVEMVIVNSSIEDSGVFACLAHNSAGRSRSNYTIRVLMNTSNNETVFIFGIMPKLAVGIAATVAFLILLICFIGYCHRKMCKKRRERKRAEAVATLESIQSKDKIQDGLLHGKAINHSKNTNGIPKTAQNTILKHSNDWHSLCNRSEFTTEEPNPDLINAATTANCYAPRQAQQSNLDNGHCDPNYVVVPRSVHAQWLDNGTSGCEDFCCGQNPIASNSSDKCELSLTPDSFLDTTYYPRTVYQDSYVGQLKSPEDRIAKPDGVLFADDCRLIEKAVSEAERWAQSYPELYYPFANEYSQFRTHVSGLMTNALPDEPPKQLEPAVFRMPAGAVATLPRNSKIADVRSSSSVRAWNDQTTQSQNNFQNKYRGEPRKRPTVKFVGIPELAEDGCQI